jgi:molecular chaperone DnaK (HSP70)
MSPRTRAKAWSPKKTPSLGEFLVEGLSEVPSGNPVVIHFELDLNGMLKVTA